MSNIEILLQKNLNSNQEIGEISTVEFAVGVQRIMILPRRARERPVIHLQRAPATAARTQARSQYGRRLDHHHQLTSAQLSKNSNNEISCFVVAYLVNAIPESLCESRRRTVDVHKRAFVRL